MGNIPQRFFAIYEEKTGIAGNAPIFIDLISEDLTAESEMIQQQETIMRAMRRDAAGQVIVGGGCEFICDYKYLGYFLKAAIGQVSSNIDFNTGEEDEHVFFPSDTILPTYTILVATDQNLFSFHGMFAESISLDMTAANFMKATVDWKGMDFHNLKDSDISIDDNFTVNIDSVATTPLIHYHDTQLWLGTVNTVPANQYNLTSFKMDIGNNFAAPPYLGSRHVGDRNFPRYNGTTLITEHANPGANGWSLPGAGAGTIASSTDLAVTGATATQITGWDLDADDGDEIVFDFSTAGVSIDASIYTRMAFFFRYSISAGTMGGDETMDVTLDDVAGAGPEALLTTIDLDGLTEDTWYLFVADLTGLTTIDLSTLDQILWEINDVAGANTAVLDFYIDGISFWNHQKITPQGRTVTASADTTLHETNLEGYKFSGAPTGVVPSDTTLIQSSLRLRSLSEVAAGDENYKFELYFPSVAVKDGSPAGSARDQKTMSLNFQPIESVNSAALAGITETDNLTTNHSVICSPYYYDFFALLWNITESY